MSKSTTSFAQRELSEDESIIANPKGRFLHLFMFLGIGDLPLLAGALISTILCSLTSTTLSIIMGKVFDVLTLYGEGRYRDFGDFDNHLKIACFSISALGGVVLVVSWLSISMWMALGERQAMRVRSLLYSSLFNRSISWYETNLEVKGEIVQINRCVEEFRAGVSESAALMLQSTFSGVALIVTSFIYSWKLTFIVLCSAPIIAVVAWLFNTKISKSTESENDFGSESSKILDFALSNQAFVKIFNSRLSTLSKFKKAIARSRLAFNRLCFYSSANVAILRLLVLMMFVQAFWFGYHLVQEGEITSGTVITTFMSCLLLAGTTNEVTEQLIYLQKAKVALVQIVNFVGEENLNVAFDYVEPERKLYPSTCSGELEFEHVDFSYELRPNVKVLNDVCMRFPSGSLNFIVGKSGSGKSTLSSLLMDFYKPLSGTISIDGIKVSDLSSLWLTDKITLVQQDASLFTDSLRNNIALGVASKQDIETVSQSQIQEAIQVSLLQSMTLDLPDGTETMLGAKGKNLSGGQRQRVALARARIRDTPILILDESLSALDATQKELLICAIKTWRKNKTTIIMTHDFDQIENDDFVFVMENGKVVERGYRYELASLYKEPNDLTLVNYFEDKFEITTEEDEQNSVYKSGKIDHFFDARLSRMSKTPFNRFSIATEKGLNYLFKPNKAYSRGSERVERELKLEEEERPEKLATVFQISKFISKHSNCRWAILTGIFCAVLNGASNPVFSYCFSKLLGSVVNFSTYKHSSYILKWSLIVAGIALGDGVTTFAKKYLLGYASESLVIQLRETIFDLILKQDLSWGESSLHQPNEISALLMNDSRDMRAFVSEFLDALFTVIVMMNMGLIWSLVVGWKLSLVGMSLIPMFAVVTCAYSLLLQRQENEYKTRIAEYENHQHDTVSGIKTIKCLRLNSYFNKKFRTYKKKVLEKGYARAIVTGFGLGCSNLLTFVSQSLILYYGLRLVGQEEYSSTQFTEVLTLLVFTISMSSAFMNQLPDMTRAQRASTYLINLFSIESHSFELEGVVKPDTNNSENVIEFNSVSFHYSTTTIDVLRHVSFEVHRKEIFGIVGESGSGKSTILSLILKLQMCENLKLWDTDLQKIDTDYLRSHMGVVSQTPTFFEGSIKDNLLYGLSETKSTRELHEVLKLAQIYDFVVSLPQGLETNIGNDTTLLISGGQAQRLSIARALLRNPEILLLDECTSALDPINAAEIRALIDSKLRFMGITIVIVTHHEPMMNITDRLIVMKDGEIRQTGKFCALAAKQDGELYRTLHCK